ncbi:hypothetical protein H0H93_016122 [Arthromyces matolae]|nr:hypothetical protein H0H93_016122 [Arthromyces matolae]
MPLSMLPAHPTASWSPAIYQAYEILGNSYNHASQILLQEAEASRLKYHAETMTSDLVPILLSLEQSATDEGLPLAWVQEIATTIGTTIAELFSAYTSAQQRDDSQVVVPAPVVTVPTKKRGRPRTHIDPDLLREATSSKRNISITKLAALLNVSRPTLYAHLRKNNISHKFSELPTADLENLVKVYRGIKPSSGIRYLTGFLRTHGLRVQRRRIIAAIHKVDRLGNTMRKHTTIQRREYRVSRPNALWHVDGHHKLILWGIVIHGFVDGYCRTVTGLRASTNNLAHTVLEVFLDAIRLYGQPSRVRADRGRENKAIATYMIMRQGLNRGSFIWGSSTHNTRVERIWVEVGTQFVRAWRAFFYRLEDLHQLVRQNPTHLWLLHYLFLWQINEDCQKFQDEWNAHPIWGRGHNMSPIDMRLTGQVAHGVYVDDCEGLDPAEIAAAYGVFGSVRDRSLTETGAGALPEDVLFEEEADGDEETGIVNDDNDDDEGWEDAEMDDLLGSQYSKQFISTSVKVPRCSSPFNETQMATFETALQQVIQAGVIPQGYGIHPEEWIDGDYPSVTVIPGRRRGKKDLQVSLPDHIWRPRSILWVQGLDVMRHLTYILE